MDLFDTYRILGSSVKTQSNSMNMYAKNMSSLENLSSTSNKYDLHKNKKSIFQFNSMLNDEKKNRKVLLNRKKDIKNITNLGSNKNKKFFIDSEDKNVEFDSDLVDNYLSFIESSNQYKIDLSMLSSTKSIILNTLSIIEK